MTFSQTGVAALSKAGKLDVLHKMVAGLYLTVKAVLRQGEKQKVNREETPQSQAVLHKLGQIYMKL